MPKSKIHKEYVNAWKPYEKPYLKLLVINGHSLEDAINKLAEINMKLGVPYRSEGSVRNKIPGYRILVIRARNKEIGRFSHENKANMTLEQLAKHFDRSIPTIRTNVKKYLSGYFDNTIT